MSSILEELFYGNICPSTMCIEENGTTKQLRDYITRHHDELYSTLTEQQKEIFEKYKDCYTELMSIYERDIFIYAFKLGANIAIEILFQKADK